MQILLDWGNAFARLEPPIRWTLVFVLGLLVGSQLNRGIYRLAWNSRQIGPWSSPPNQAPPRSWFDYVPVFGWLGLDRESSLHGSLYWIRPLLIEFGFAIGLVGLYVWENDGGLVAYVPGIEGVIHWQFLSHAILLSWMVMATFIDFDEKLIPDAITIPGTLVGFCLAALVPHSLLPDVNGALLCTSPFKWPHELDAWPGLLAGLVAFWTWCFALLPKTIYFRRGIAKGISFLMASMVRTRIGLWIYAFAILGSLGMAGVWWCGNPYWPGLLTSLAGMAFGLMLTWSVRTVAGLSMGREALGFGDVTLMAMIGSYTGWQPILMIFGVAPFAAVFIAMAQYLLTRSNEIAYGPFLCAATVIVLLRWSQLWNHFGAVYTELGGWLLAILAGCLVLMGLMLGSLRLIRSVLASS